MGDEYSVMSDYIDAKSGVTVKHNVCTPNEEELADILEVIDGMAQAFNLDMDKVLTVKAAKLEKRGGFKERIILEKLIE